jgi:hypothetical protein
MEQVSLEEVLQIIGEKELMIIRKNKEIKELRGQVADLRSALAEARLTLSAKEADEREAE